MVKDRLQTKVQKQFALTMVKVLHPQSTIGNALPACKVKGKSSVPYYLGRDLAWQAKM